MPEKPKLTEEEREKLVQEWTHTPAVNPRYRGVTPAEVARALLRRDDDDDPRQADRPAG